MDIKVKGGVAVVVVVMLGWWVARFCGCVLAARLLDFT